MGFEKTIKVEITGDLAAHVEAAVGEHGLYATPTEYVRDLIRHDMDRDDREVDAYVAEVRAAFEAPVEGARHATAADVIARNGLAG